MPETDSQLSSGKLFRERLANIRHDLKTPVSHIMGYSEMIEEDVEDDLPEVVNDLRNIRNSGERILESINHHLANLELLSRRLTRQDVMSRRLIVGRKH